MTLFDDARWMMYIWWWWVYYYYCYNIIVVNGGGIIIISICLHLWKWRDRIIRDVILTTSKNKTIYLPTPECKDDGNGIIVAIIIRRWPQCVNTLTSSSSVPRPSNYNINGCDAMAMEGWIIYIEGGQYILIIYQLFGHDGWCTVVLLLFQGGHWLWWWWY
jgi:hypothetical protein